MVLILPILELQNKVQFNAKYDAAAVLFILLRA